MGKGWTIPIIFGVFILIVFIVRLLNPVELDDLTPGIPCENELLKKADILWVVPNFENNSIAQNKTWCNEILSLNKTIGMHGINHNFREFKENITKEKIQQGVEIFENCFGFTPVMFKPPQLAISKEAKILIEESGMEIILGSNQLMHKIYHCNDSDLVKNWMVKIF
ncbi:MAG: DUF2334 domain-containing protein [Nanoarchaeota archaeon]|nr:DUF2334 domain-containing protein [Nanoarchaeota archaeon]